MFKILKNQSGFSLIEGIIGSAISISLLVAFLQLTKNQESENQYMAALLARDDFERSISGIMRNEGPCSFVLADPSQSSNRSTSTFNSNAVKNGSVVPITIHNLFSSASASSEVIGSVGGAPSVLSRKLVISSMTFQIKASTPFMDDTYLADFHIKFNKVNGVDLKEILLNTIQIYTTGPAGSKRITGCSSWGKPVANRYHFSTSRAWTVPSGVTRAFVTMAGGGGSGVGWRIGNCVTTGHSGGYVFSHPVDLIPGEVLQIVVGRGGVGKAPIRTTIPAGPSLGSRVYSPPLGDDGRAGYPGEPSRIVSSKNGILLECLGGYGAFIQGVDSQSPDPNDLVPGNIRADLTGSGYGTSPTTIKRYISGSFPHIAFNSTCKANSDYGRGNLGPRQFSPDLGLYDGGFSPLGYGSGGDVSVTRCYVTPTKTGTCTSPRNGRDGVVYIDVY